ncbi:MAG: arginine--tRNA ligase [Kiritimatiellae bacterium]|nr:arginine--tRNA ligase [Kiritimatiellia bacterium]
MDCEGLVKQWLSAAFEAAEPGCGGGNKVVPSKDARFGDWQCNDAMGIAKRAGKNPRALAEAVIQALPLPDILEKAEVAGPGFINLTLSRRALAAGVEFLSDDVNLGIPQSGANEKVVIDYSSPNVAKPMHIGHIRSTVIGNAIDRILRALGYDVIADNHLGDWGTQFGILIMGYRRFLTDDERANLTVELLEKVYVQSYNATKEDPAWLDTCREELVKLQAGDEENLAVWKRFIEISLNEFGRIYGRLDVSFDLYRGESYYQPMLEPVVETLKEKGLATLSDGAWIVDMKDEGLEVAIVRKRDGGFNYTSTDIATVKSRTEEFDPARIIYVTDDRQQLHFKQFFAICGKLGFCAKAALQHVPFGLMRLPEGTFSTRQGNVIKLETLLDEAAARARKIVDESHPDWTEEARATLAEAIGIGAIKYADLSHDPATMIVFTWERALALEGNSGPYLQYANARLNSLIARYQAETGRNPKDNPLLITGDAEKALALHLLQYPNAVQRAGDLCKPSVLADYLYQLSQLYSSFYQSSPVLKAEPEVRDSRIRLCDAVSKVLRGGLTLLGIPTPERI